MHVEFKVRLSFVNWFLINKFTNQILILAKFKIIPCKIDR